MNFPNPAELEIRIKRAERSTCKRLANLDFSWIVVGLIFLIGLFFAIETLQLNKGEFFLHNGGFQVFFLARRALFAAIVLSPILIYTRERYQILLQLTGLLIVWAASVTSFVPFVDGHVISIVSLSVPILLIMSWAYVRFFACGERKAWRAIAYSIAFWSVSFATHYAIYSSGDYPSLKLYLQFKMGFIWLAALTFGGTSNSSEDARAFLNPVNAIRGEIWPNGTKLVQDDPSLKKRLWWQGFLNLANAAVVLSLFMWLQPIVFGENVPPYWRALSFYLLGILADIGFMNLISGLARMYGFDVRDATNFVWLSRTPAEYWRRGSVYHYTFILKYVYLPIYQLIRTRFFASSIAFLIFMFNKNGFLNSGLLIADLCGIKFNNHLYRPYMVHSTLCLWLLWYIVLVITRRFWFVPRSKQNHSQVAWVSIFITHFVMSNLYYFADLLRHYLW